MATQIISGTAPNVTSETLKYNSSESTFAFYGDFGGGTLTVEASFDSGVTFITLKKSSGDILEIAEDEIHTIALGRCLIRYTITGATSAPTVNVTIKD